MPYVSARVSRRLVRRLRRNYAALVMAGGSLPGDCWVETLEAPGGVWSPGDWRWQVACVNGWSNIGSRWPLHLILNAPEIHFRPTPDRRRVNVEITP